MGYRIPHTGLRGQMHDGIEAPCGEKPRHTGAIGDIQAHKGKLRFAAQPCQPGLFERDIVVVVEIVDAKHRVAARKQARGQRIADETGGAGYENVQSDSLHSILCRHHPRMHDALFDIHFSAPRIQCLARETV